MVVHEQGHDASAVSAVKLSEIDYLVKKRGYRSGAQRPHAALLCGKPFSDPYALCTD